MGWWSDFAKAAASEMGTKLAHPLEAMQAPSQVAGALLRGVVSSAQGAPIKFTPEEFEREGIGEMVGAGATGLGEELAEALFPGVEAQRSALQDWAEGAAAIGSEGILAEALPAGVSKLLSSAAGSAIAGLPAKFKPGAVPSPEGWITPSGGSWDAGLLRDTWRGRDMAYKGADAITDLRKAQVARDILGMNKAGDPIRRVWDLSGPAGAADAWSVTPLRGGARAAADVADARKLFKARRDMAMGKGLEYGAEAARGSAKDIASLIEQARALDQLNPTLF